MAALRAQVQDLKAKVEALTLDEKSFKLNDEKVAIFTGIPKFSVLKIVLRSIEKHLKFRVLSPFQQLLLTLMKLRLNVTTYYLSHVFGVHRSTISRVFKDVIHLLYSRFVPLAVFWPDREGVLKNLPVEFQSLFPRCTSIIDCFEIFVERSARLDNRCSTYSNYKSHNTCKYLISITPQGFVNFVSFGWGGRSSDRKITEDSGYLNYITPSDQVLADRGFNIAEVIALHNATLHIPAFTKGKPQLSNLEVTSTRQLASVRIHVERVIGCVRQKYPILSSTVPVSYLALEPTSNCTILDKIVHVCCGLSNVCDGIVPLS